MTAAYGVFADSVAVNEVIQTLNRGGFDKESVCMMLSPSHPIATVVRESASHSDDGASARTAAVIGWLSGLGAVVIPTFGFFIRSTEFLHALGVGRESIAGCGSSATLSSLGFPEEDAERFKNQMHERRALLYVSCPENVQTQVAFELLRASGADEAGVLKSEPEIEIVA